VCSLFVLLAGAAYADSSAVIEHGHFAFARDNAAVTFDADGALKITVGDRSITYLRVGDNVSGNFVVATGGDVAVVPYSYANGSLQMDASQIDRLSQTFIDGLPGGAASLQKLGDFINDYAHIGTHVPQTRGAHAVSPDVTDCQFYQALTIGSFVACPGSYGLGCGAGLFFLYKEISSC
jgi:hypothetical protein